MIKTTRSPKTRLKLMVSRKGVRDGWRKDSEGLLSKDTFYNAIV
jgi:hypothetical protein